MEDAGKEGAVLANIQGLVSEEHKLFEQESLADQARRVKDFEVELDQRWDLLRQRGDRDTPCR